jgi:DNA polymerase III subunit delta
MVIFLYGPDSYRSRQYLAQVVAQFKAKVAGGQLAVAVLSGDQVTAEAIRQAGQGTTLLATRQLLVVEGLFDAKKVSADVADAVTAVVASQAGDEPHKNVVMFYQGGMPDQRLALFKLLASQPRAQLFEPMDPGQASRWARAEVARRGATLQPAAATALVAAIGVDGWALSNACAILAAYRHGGTVTAADVGQHAVPLVSASIFALADALGSRNVAVASQLLQHLLASGEEPLYILAMLSRQLRLISLAKDEGLAPAALASRRKLPPFVAAKLVRQAELFTWPRLAAAYAGLRAADAALKTTGLGGPAVLQKLVVGI